MEFTDNAATGDLLAEISRLEDRVLKLSLQLETDRQTIDLLRESLLERDSRISELESNLVLTPKFMLHNIQNQLFRYKNQLKNGLDEKLIHPPLREIRRQMQFVQRLMAESSDFFTKAKLVIRQQIETSGEFLRRSPEQGQLYLEKTIVEPLRLLVRRTIETSDRYLKSARQLLTEQIIAPAKSFYEHSKEAILALPAQSRIITQVWLVEPTLHNLREFSDFSRKLSDETISELKSLLARLKELINRSVDALSEQVKKSPFWDGKRNTEAFS